MGYSFVSQALLAASTIFQIFPTAVCDEPTWSCYETTGNCYYLEKVELKRPASTCWCHRNGGYLLQINSQTELALIRLILENSSHPADIGFYIGARDRKDEGNFVWDNDGTEAGSILPWNGIEPNNANGGEDCVLMSNRLWYTTNQQLLPEYMTFDSPCSEKHYSICEKGSIQTQVWRKASSDEKYLKATILSYSYTGFAACANLCLQNCGCLAFGYNSGFQGGFCMLYNKFYTEMKNRATFHLGFITYD